MHLHESAEMHTKTIYTLVQECPSVRIADVAQVLGVDRGSAARNACKIERDISDAAYEAIKEHMKLYRRRKNRP